MFDEDDLTLTFQEFKNLYYLIEEGFLDWSAVLREEFYEFHKVGSDSISNYIQ